MPGLRMLSCGAQSRVVIWSGLLGIYSYEGSTMDELNRVLT